MMFGESERKAPELEKFTNRASAQGQMESFKKSTRSVKRSKIPLDATESSSETECGTTVMEQS